jgi:DNA mismatch repair protein MutS2
MEGAHSNHIRVLEWNRFLELACQEAKTETGKTLLSALAHADCWALNLAEAKILQQETNEIIPFLDRDALWGPLQDLADPTDLLERLGRGSVLELIDLVSLRKWLYAIDSWTQIPREEIRGERFKKAITQLSEPFEPLRTLDKILTPEGELSERASPKLATLYSEIRALRRDIGNILDQVIKTFSSKGVLQENFSDVRDGRYVIPVKISSQNEVEGIIYEASASRQTVFVEPREVAVLNNKLRQRQNDLIQEIYIVLTETSKRLQPYAGEIANSAIVLSHWDSVQAKARLGRHYSGKPIQVTEERRFRLRETAHPLLWWSLPPESIIRNEVDFGDPLQTLLLTGPNTGGKTVLLKTLGFAGLCARTGFLFPAIDQPIVPFFDSFFADLGDPQSIEQHLSSFSGHVLRFKEMLEQVNAKSLVLIDELNTATDPEEGAALGRAFLETLMQRGALLVATTHDPHIKALSVSDHRILNASMAFDEASRTPTYRVLLGVPGRSRALETAERLGIGSEILALAKTYLSKDHLEFERLLSRLESDSREAERARKDAVHIREEAEKMKREWTQKTETSVGEMLERTRQRLRRILEQAQDEVRASVQKLDEIKNRRDLDQTRGQLNETFTVSAARLESALTEEAPEIAEALARVKTEPPARIDPLQVGTKVRIPKWKSTGTILEIKNDKVKVAMGTIQMTLSSRDIEPMSKSESLAADQLNKINTAKKKAYVETVATPPSQIDLRGIRLDEAMSELERYLDQAFRSGSLAEVTVVHGLGTGAIREGARKIISNLPYIKAFRDGGVGLGGAGATIVEFETD